MGTGYVFVDHVGPHLVAIAAVLAVWVLTHYLANRLVAAISSALRRREYRRMWAARTEPAHVPAQRPYSPVADRAHAVR